MRRGFTLAETVIVISMVALLLTVIGSLFWRFSNTMRHSGRKETALTGALDAIDRVGADLASAVNITNPGAAFSSSVNLTRMYPYDDTRYPTPLALPTAAWAPHPVALQETVAYAFLANGELNRSVTFNSTTTTSLAARGLSFFQCRVQPGNRFATIQVTVMRNAVAQVVTRDIQLHLPPAVVP